MTKKVNFSPTTGIFFTYTLAEYPSRIPDPALPLTFKDAMELLQLRSMFRKATEQLEAARAMLEEEQEQKSCEASRSRNISMRSDSTETPDSMSKGSSDSGCADLRRGEVLSKTRTLDLDEISSKCKVELVQRGRQPEPALVTLPASPLSVTRGTGQASTKYPPLQTEPSVFGATSRHPSRPPSPVSSALHSLPPKMDPSLDSSRCEKVEILLQQPSTHCSIPNNSSRNHGPIGPMTLSPTAKSLGRRAASPTTSFPSSNNSSCSLQEYQSIAQDPNASHPNDIRPYSACLVQV